MYLFIEFRKKCQRRQKNTKKKILAQDIVRFLYGFKGKAKELQFCNKIKFYQQTDFLLD